MKDGTLTRRGKVVYRSHRNLRDRVKRVFRFSDLCRVSRSVIPQVDATLILDNIENIKRYREFYELTEGLKYLLLDEIGKRTLSEAAALMRLLNLPSGVENASSKQK